jgi:hypothetical protein
VEIPVESEEKNSHLFYAMIVIIVLGFVASLAFPLKAPKLSSSKPSLSYSSANGSAAWRFNPH